MKLYNCETELELKLKATDLTKLTVNELKSLTVDIKTDAMNGYLENDIIVMDALSEIILELAERSEK